MIQHNPHFQLLKFIANNSKFFIPLCIVVGIVRMLLFYNHFNINISSFISLSDFLLMSLDKSLILVGFSLIGIFFLGMLIPNRFYFANADSLKVSTTFKQRMKRNALNFGALLFVLVSCFLNYNRGGIYYYYFLQILPMVFIMIHSIFYEELIRYWNLSIAGKVASSLNASLLLMVALLFIYENLVRDIVNIEFFKQPRVEYAFPDKTIVCGDSLKIVGESSEFLFLYNAKLKRSLVISTEGLTKVENYQK